LGKLIVDEIKVKKMQESSNLAKKMVEMKVEI
jgi:hypothetical protein